MGIRGTAWRLNSSSRSSISGFIGERAIDPYMLDAPSSCAAQADWTQRAAAGATSLSHSDGASREEEVQAGCISEWRERDAGGGGVAGR